MGGPGKQWTMTEEESEMARVKGRWANRCRVEGGEVWFF